MSVSSMDEKELKKKKEYNFFIRWKQGFETGQWPTSNNILLCGDPVEKWTSWRPSNPGRRFIGCPNYRDPSRDCKFFDWVDPKLTNQWYIGQVAKTVKMANDDGEGNDEGRPTKVAAGGRALESRATARELYEPTILRLKLGSLRYSSSSSSSSARLKSSRVRVFSESVSSISRAPYKDLISQLHSEGNVEVEEAVADVAPILVQGADSEHLQF
ncbi:hypothetical protein LXL04_015474 [Taraxacum kok-saghyz]